MKDQTSPETEREWARQQGIVCKYPDGADRCPGCPHYHSPKKYPKCAYDTGASDQARSSPVSRLLPCPFCGGKADFEEIKPQGGAFVFWSVGCQSSEADCIGYQMLAHYNRKCEAVEAWNKRSGHAQSPDQPVAWIAFAGNGNIRFWTSDPHRSQREKERGLDLRAFTMAELIALISRIPVPAQSPDTSTDRTCK